MAEVVAAEKWPGQVEGDPAFFGLSWLPLEIGLVDESRFHEEARSRPFEVVLHLVGGPLGDEELVFVVVARQRQARQVLRSPWSQRLALDPDGEQSPGQSSDSASPVQIPTER